MDQITQKQWVWTIVASFIIGILANLLTNFFIGWVCGVAAGMAVFFILDRNSKHEKPTPTETTPEDPTETAIESLLSVNLDIRMAAPPDPVIRAYEALIDRIIALLPQVATASPGGELAWTVSRIATEYIPNKSAAPYLALAPQDRASKQSDVLNGLAAIDEQIEEISAMVSRRQTDEFDAKAEFLRRRFGV